MTRILNDIRDEVGSLAILAGELAMALALGMAGWYMLTLVGAQIR